MIQVHKQDLKSCQSWKESNFTILIYFDERKKYNETQTNFTLKYEVWTVWQNSSHLLITYQATANMPATQVPLITQLHTKRAVT